MSGPTLARERTWQGDRGRRGLLAVFHNLGPEHERVRRYRGEPFRLVH